MDEKAEERVRDKRSSDGTSEVDGLSKLPESLLVEILLNLSTKDVVKSSVLSSRWRNIWKYVPGLDLNYRDFPECNTLVSFVDRFLKFNSESWMQNLKISYDWDENDDDSAHVKRWINTVVNRKVKNLDVLNYSWGYDEVTMPPTVNTCESLVSLKLFNVVLADPEFVALPCLKVIDMDMVKFANDLALEKLISCCPVLESFTIRRNPFDNVQVLRVRSKSLLSFTHVTFSNSSLDENQEVVIDAPKLKYLRLNDNQTASFIINNQMCIVKVDISIISNLCLQGYFDSNDLQKRQMVRNILVRNNLCLDGSAKRRI